jgi:hypothetical protein
MGAMSTYNEIDIPCENCGEEFKGVVWTAVHATEDPVLKDILFGGELNLLMCPKCAHVAYQESFVLYQDPKAELIAYIYPPSQKAEEDFLSKTMLLNFHEAQKLYRPEERKNYEPILIFGLATFVEMMREEESRAEQSQIAEAICKEHKIPYTVLRPSEARRLASIRVRPSTAAGLNQLLAINPSLHLYSSLRQGSVEK